MRSEEDMVRELRQCGTWIPDELLEKIFYLIDDRADRNSISLVCKHWYLVDSLTRRKLVVCFSYAANPAALSRRFKNLQVLKIKGEPRVSEFGLLGSSWGGYAQPWIEELKEARNFKRAFESLSSLHLLRMKVFDSDLRTLAQSFNTSLQVVRINKCSGFSTAGLFAIAHSCRDLRVLDLEESLVYPDAEENDWLHELAIHNNQLEVLNFFLTGMDIGDMEDIAAIIKKCSSLRCLKMSEIDVVNMRGTLGASNSLRQLAVLYGANDHTNVDQQFELPRTITSFAGDIPLPLDRIVGLNLSELDLMSTATTFNAEAHVEVISCCPNLETLKVRNVIGDSGLQAVATHCKKLKKIRIENLEDHHGFVSHLGLELLATSCIHLETVAIYVSDIANSALQAFGKFCPRLVDFRLVLLDSSLPATELPLDNGIQILLEGCKLLRKLAIYLRPGGLTDQGLSYVGTLGRKLKWILLGYVGDSDLGLHHIATGCTSLVKLELRGCPFSDAGIAEAVRCIGTSLRFMWIQGLAGHDLCSFLRMGNWRVEYIPGNGSPDPNSSQIVAYRSLAPHRTDCPPEVVPLSQIAERLLLERRREMD